MKTASEFDMTKEAGLEQFLGQAGNFINNMPNNPAWQNALAGGGSLALPLLLINLLSGRSPLRGLLPALLLGGALGGGLPAAFNAMNERGMFGNAKQPPPTLEELGYSMDNVPAGDYGPPGSGQYWDEKGRLNTLMTPPDIEHTNRMAASPHHGEGTLAHWWNKKRHAYEKGKWDFEGPSRGLDNTLGQIKKHGLGSLRIDRNPFADPWDTPFNHGVKPTAAAGN